MSVFTQDGTENRMRWDRRSPGFMEVWYSTVTHRESGCGVWLRYTLTAPDRGDPFCELWGFVFDPTGKLSFAAKDRHPIDALGSANGRDDGALVRIGDAWLSETGMNGRLERDGRDLVWSLNIEPSPRTFWHLPPQLRHRMENRVSTVCSPNLSVPFTGEVVVDGVPLTFDGEPGCQSHRWGKRHSETWTWAHCAEFEEEPAAVFEGIAAKANLGPLPGPTVTYVYLRYRGQDLVFNDLRSSLRSKSRYELPRWAFTATNEEWKIAGAARSRVDRMVQVTYQDPDGSARHCANSEIADLGLEIYRRVEGGWRHEGSLTTLGRAHLEFGQRPAFPEVPVSF